MVNEMAMIVSGGYIDAGFRDIILARCEIARDQHGAFTTINPHHRAYLPLHYVLFFPYGELGGH